MCVKPILLAVVDELRGELAVAEPAVRVARVAPPTAEVHFVDRHRRVERVVLAAGVRSTRRRSTGSVSRSVTMLAVRGGTSAAKPYGSHFSTTCPPRCFTANL